VRTDPSGARTISSSALPRASAGYNVGVLATDSVVGAPEVSPHSDDFDLWIEAGRTERRYWLDLWRYRELLFVLAWRDVAVRYKQTIAGAAWAVIQPLLTMAIMTAVFNKVAGLPSDGNAPYAVMVFAAMLPWQFFANAVAAAGQSVVANANLISKVYFPRLIVPLSSVAVSLADFAVSCSILAVLMVLFRVPPTWRLATLPVFAVLAILAAAGPSLIITAVSVRYRDIRFVVPFIVQVGLYVSPVAYSTAVIRARLGDGWFRVYALNPMVGVIDGFRWAIGGGALDASALILSVLIATAILVVGLRYFRGTERAFADII
jgi:lipopolysaccharide transport system permease protein